MDESHINKHCLLTMYFALMALIGEQFEEGEEIRGDMWGGLVANVRQRQGKLALWTKAASNEAFQTSIGRKWKEIIDYNDKIVYSFHILYLPKANKNSDFTCFSPCIRGSVVGSLVRRELQAQFQVAPV